jgi:hypothetical protein
MFNSIEFATKLNCERYSQIWIGVYEWGNSHKVHADSVYYIVNYSIVFCLNNYFSRL